MKREIKFKVYNPENGVITQGQCFETFVLTAKTVDFSKLILMQFTGRKDDNEVEIYEGDIVQWDSEDSKVTAEVIFKLSEEENLCISAFEFKILKVEEYEHDEPIPFLVIGNIHKNPELLTQKQ